MLLQRQTCRVRLCSGFKQKFRQGFYQLLCLGLLITLSVSAYSDKVMVGDIAVDEQKFAANNDTATRTEQCLMCHGKFAGGDSDFGPDVHFGTPALRGLQQSYLRQSLDDYRSGRRPHAEMSVIASLLDDETIDFMSRTFSEYPVPVLKSAMAKQQQADADAVFRRGQAIAERGIVDATIAACASCHGVSGEGIDSLGPRLAGQNALYFRRQLDAFAKNKRTSEQARMMQPIAEALTDSDARAVAYYYQQLLAP